MRQAALESLCYRAARDANLSVTADELQRASDDFRQRHALRSADDTQLWLADNQLTPFDLASTLERDLLTDKFAEHLFAQHGQAYFDAHRADFEGVHLHRRRAESELAAQEILFAIGNEGADFAGDDLGVYFRCQLYEVVADAAFAAGEGEIVGPLSTPNGYGLFLIKQHLPADLAAAKTVIRQRLFEQWVQSQQEQLQLDLRALLEFADEPR
jgi:hypothetical protein